MINSRKKQLINYYLGYWRSSAELRVILQHKIDDNAFVKQYDGHIVYVFDANVVRFFLNPARESKLIAAFRDEEYLTHLIGTAMITAEYLFSRRLVGQHETSSFITPSHAEDLSNIMYKVELELRKQIIEQQQTHLNLPPETHRHLIDLVNAVKRGKKSLNESLGKLRKELPTITSQLFQGSTYEAINYIRLYREDLLRPLALDPRATAEILDPDIGLVDDWEKLIKSQKYISEGQNQGKFLEKIKRDARSLVQIILLNKSAETETPPVRYVMVTADQALHRAYSSWFWDNPEPFSAFFALRHPLQYVPMLNAQEIGDRYNQLNGHDHRLGHSNLQEGQLAKVDSDAKEGVGRNDDQGQLNLIKQTQDALDSFLCNVREANQNYPYILSRDLAKISSSHYNDSNEELQFSNFMADLSDKDIRDLDDKLKIFKGLRVCTKTNNLILIVLFW